jgi:hypothetical protein
MWIVPAVALVAGLIGYFRCVNAKNSEAFKYLYCAGLFILVWILTFNGFPLR